MDAFNSKKHDVDLQLKVSQTRCRSQPQGR